ncbi:DUF4767 domain-containing protein [Liquorilactobacillus oeni]|uniref:DUF4767 domain-containing protein n=1 Tax=Liquorilactobacillus oeni DSM 19972 TaxID=1423777 RepID=A0A0R1MKQ4_9LACO|nr:DUF4767 domain-containing protein [Liquorilactobacillus oeni]KRL05099.1 hypothetical protein FD46_GL001044 [Liquorilactobacillus oeni DSM 19972]
MKIKPHLFILLLFSALLLTACSVNNAQQIKTTADSSKNSLKTNNTQNKAASSERVKNKKGLWNTEKAVLLRKFVNQWQQAMKQNYTSYSPRNSVSFYGVKFPAELKKGHIEVNNDKSTLEWSETGRGNKEYEVVAVYSDINADYTTNKHLYLFAFHHGRPVVLITQQNQETVDKMLYFKPTQNSDLQAGFSNIAAEKNSSASPNSTLGQELVPPVLQHTWYHYDEKGILNKVTFTNNTLVIISNGVQSTNYIRKNSYKDSENNKQHSNWLRLSNITKDGVSYLNLRGWNQTAGAGSYFGVKQESYGDKFFPVLILANGAGIWCNNTYYTSSALAAELKNYEFSDIEYYQ